MKAFTDKLKPTGCLECISGDMVGIMMDFLAFGGTLISYGALAHERIGNINNMALMARALKLEGYILDVNTLSRMNDEEFAAFA